MPGPVLDGLILEALVLEESLLPADRWYNKLEVCRPCPAGFLVGDDIWEGPQPNSDIPAALFPKA